MLEGVLEWHNSQLMLVESSPVRTHRLAIARRMDAERMRRLMEMVKGGRVDLTPLLTHRVSLNDIKEGYRIFGDRLEGVLKIAVRPE